MTSWVSRLLPRKGRSLAAASENQRAEDRHRHQEAYGYFLPIQTRWQDNDQYGHVNNVVYYSYFDTIINQYLIRSVRGSASPILMSPFWHALVGARERKDVSLTVTFPGSLWTLGGNFTGWDFSIPP